jgi:hypothetical protein
MRGKKGAAHFEMIVSFVFFMGFVLFLFTIIKPYDTTTLSTSVVSGLYDSFEDSVFIDLTSVFLKADNTGSDCFYLELPPEIFKYNLNGPNIFVTNVSGVVVSAELAFPNIKINAEDVFYKVLISSEFESNSLGTCDEKITSYELGSLIERRVASYNALDDMATRYYSDYDGLRADLDIPAVFDFAIVSEDFPEIDMTRIVPSSGDVLAKDYFIEVLNSTGVIANDRITLRVW